MFRTIRRMTAALRGSLAMLALSCARPAEAAGGIAVAGDHFVRNGVPFTVKGVDIFGLIDPLSRTIRPDRIAARKGFGRALLLTARDQWGANTIRFQFSQDALDPQDPLYTQHYLDEIKAAVELARSLGFVVIVTVNERKVDAVHVGMMTAATLRADHTIAKLFGNEPDVMIDVHNEPNLPAIDKGHVINTDNWNLWLSGGVNDDGVTLVGMQTIVDSLRRAGVTNVLVIEGLKFAEEFEGIPELKDPLSNYALAAHPYISGVNKKPENWTPNFGFLADQHRLIFAEEWGAPSETKPGKRWCKDDPDLQLPGQFLQYLRQKNMGVIGWAFDVPGTIVTDYHGTPNSYDGKRCGDTGGGPGVLLQQFFLSS